MSDQNLSLVRELTDEEKSIMPECCLLCGFYATEDVEAAQEQHRLETGHGAFDYV